MTKVTILGQSHEDVKPKKKIEFVKYLGNDGSVKKGFCTSPSSFKNIELICKDYTIDGLDLMYAYNDSRNTFNCLYLGYFNDGEV